MKSASFVAAKRLTLSTHDPNPMPSRRSHCGYLAALPNRKNVSASDSSDPVSDFFTFSVSSGSAVSRAAPIFIASS